MSKNINIIQKTSEELVRGFGKASIYFMAAAALTGMLELPNHENNKIIVPGQTSFAFAGENDELQNNPPLRREKESEETSPHYLSYGVAQRTPTRSGRQ